MFSKVEYVQKGIKKPPSAAEILFSELRFYFNEVGLQGLCELVGTGSVLFTFDAPQKRVDLVGGLALDETGNALQISTASADEFYVMDPVFGIDIENDLLGTRASCRIRYHSFLLKKYFLINERLVDRGVEILCLAFPLFIDIIRRTLVRDDEFEF